MAGLKGLKGRWLKAVPVPQMSTFLLLTPWVLRLLTFLGKLLDQLSLNLVTLTKCIFSPQQHKLVFMQLQFKFICLFTDILYLGRVEHKIIRKCFILSG